MTDKVKLTKVELNRLYDLGGWVTVDGGLDKYPDDEIFEIEREQYADMVKMAKDNIEEQFNIRRHIFRRNIFIYSAIIIVASVLSVVFANSFIQ